MRSTVEEAIGGAHQAQGQVGHAQSVVAIPNSVNGVPQKRPATGQGSAKSRASLPKDKALRKMLPIGTGVLDYFPDAIAAVSFVSFIGNNQHNPGQPLHWDRGKSTDEEDTMQRHYMERGTFDDDGARHTAKLVWRALATLQKEIERDGGMLFEIRPGLLSQ